MYSLTNVRAEKNIGYVAADEIACCLCLVDGHHTWIVLVLRIRLTGDFERVGDGDLLDASRLARFA